MIDIYGTVLSRKKYIHKQGNRSCLSAELRSDRECLTENVKEQKIISHMIDKS